MSARMMVRVLNYADQAPHNPTLVVPKPVADWFEQHVFRNEALYAFDLVDLSDRYGRVRLYCFRKPRGIAKCST